MTLRLGTNSSRDLIFKTGGNAATNDRMTITKSGEVGVKTTTPTSGFEVNTSFAVSYNSTSSDYTLTSDDVVIGVDASANPISITLPSAAGATGRKYTIKVTDFTNPVEVVTSGGETIDGVEADISSNAQYE